MKDETMKAAERAVAEARLAYQFSPGSYTHGTLVECLRIRDALAGPWWIDEYEDYRRNDAPDAPEQQNMQAAA